MFTKLNSFYKNHPEKDQIVTRVIDALACNRDSSISFMQIFANKKSYSSDEANIFCNFNIDYFTHLEAYRNSGIVNMMDSPYWLSAEFKMDKERSIDIVSFWMKNKHAIDDFQKSRLISDYIPIDDLANIVREYAGLPKDNSRYEMKNGIEKIEEDLNTYRKLKKMKCI